MRKTFTAATAFAGSALEACLLWGSAQATSAPVLKSGAGAGMVTLVGHGSGHGGRMDTELSSTALQNLLGVNKVALNDLAKRGIVVRGDRKGYHRLS
jgi:hypothetical protein